MNIPPFLTPWLDRFYAPEEITLLQALENEPVKKEHLLKLLGKNSISEERYDFDRFLSRAWQRGVVKFLDDRTIAQEDFHVRFEYWALFEGWQDLPAEIKGQLNDWELNHYIASHGRAAEKLKDGLKRDPHKVYPEYLLLDEVAALFKKIPKFYLWPCNCRAMVKGCGQSEFTCIRFSNDRKIGWEISREKALAIVKQANKKGLMQNAELGLDEQGRIIGALCNCCSDCCFPHQLSERLNVEKFWPLSRYVAQAPTQDCNGCGICVKRCPFGIISQNKKFKHKKRQEPFIDVEKCRGCGVCATGCPRDAIHLKQVKESLFEEII